MVTCSHSEKYTYDYVLLWINQSGEVEFLGSQSGEGSMNLSQLYYFRKLAEVEHYGKASEELFITQPSLSNSIGNLEKELGVRLFERVGRNVRLTSYGIEFNEHICQALNEVDKAVNLMKLYSSGMSGQIRIGTVISIQRDFLPRLLNAFREEFGDGIVFDIHQETTYGCIKGLRDGRFDVAFCGRLHDEQGIAYKPMFAQRLVIGVDPSHELASRESVSLNDLRDYELVSYRGEAYPRTLLDALFRRAGLSVKESFNDEISAESLVVAEKTVVAIMLDTLVGRKDGGLVYIPIEEVPGFFHAIYLAYKDNGSSSSAADQLIEFASKFANCSEDDVYFEDTIDDIPEQ